MEWIAQPDAWIALVTLTLLEIVLGIDNIVFISILSEKVEPELQAKARQLGLALAMGMRILLLFSITWVMRLTEPLFELLSQGFSGRDLILIGGGMFLLAKATFEIHESLEGHGHERTSGARTTFGAVIVQIALLDIVFSLDSVITAVGIADDIAVMVTAIVIAVGVMMVSAGPLSSFVSRHPTVKMLALSFLLLIGMTLVAEGLGQHIAKGYIYFAMGFSVMVEMLNLRTRANRKEPPVKLRAPEMPAEAADTA